MSDPTQDPPPQAGADKQPSGAASEERAAPPPPPPPPPQGGQGSYGTAPPPPPQGDWQQQGSWPGWQQGPRPYPRQGTGGIGQPADLGPRFVARLLDIILLGFVQGALVTLIFAGVMVGSNFGGAVTGWGIPNGAPWAANAVSSVITAAISLAYFSLMENKRGQTLGKMIMKLETRGPNGGRPTIEQALKRNLFVALPVIGAIPFVGGIAGLLELAAVITIAVTISNDGVNRHGWHDELAGGTTVFRIA